MTEEEKRCAHEKEERRLKAAETKTEIRIQRRLLLSAVLSLEDWAWSMRQACDKLNSMRRIHLLELGLYPFVMAIQDKKAKQEDAALDALQAGLAALHVQQEKEQRQREEQSLESRALRSLYPPCTCACVPV